MKTCAKCNIKKPLTEFWKTKSATDGLFSYCKCCGKANNHIKNRKNKAKTAAYNRQYHASEKGKISRDENRNTNNNQYTKLCRWL